MKQLMDQNQLLYFAYAHMGQYTNRITGAMSLQALLVPDGAEPMTREQQSYFDSTTGRHAAQAVAYEWDSKRGRFKKVKIKSSWGDEVGDHGYYHMYEDYMNVFMSGFSFFSDVGIKMPKAKEIVSSADDI